MVEGAWMLKGGLGLVGLVCVGVVVVGVVNGGVVGSASVWCGV